MNKNKEFQFDFDIEEMKKAGLHFGHRTSCLHPEMKPYLEKEKDTIHIINLKKTVEKLKEALSFIEELISQDKVLLLVGTKIQMKNLVKEIAEECNLPYLNERWIGGIFTNFEVIKKRVEYLKELERKKESKELEKYTKKERVKINQELGKLEIKFGGIKNLKKLPDAIFVLDMKKDNLAVKEAKMKKIKIIGIADTNVNPCMADYPIPANDDAISSVKYILDKAKEAIKNAKIKSQNTK